MREYEAGFAFDDQEAIEISRTIWGHQMRRQRRIWQQQGFNSDSTVGILFGPPSPNNRDPGYFVAGYEFQPRGAANPKRMVTVLSPYFLMPENPQLPDGRRPGPSAAEFGHGLRHTLGGVNPACIAAQWPKHSQLQNS
jgi:hypothetical protein